jgi:hypothetical protein
MAQIKEVRAIKGQLNEKCPNSSGGFAARNRGADFVQHRN